MFGAICQVFMSMDACVTVVPLSYDCRATVMRLSTKALETCQAQSSRRVAAQAAQAGKIALGPVKIRPTGQQNLTNNFQKLSCGPVVLAIQRVDCRLHPHESNKITGRFPFQLSHQCTILPKHQALFDPWPNQQTWDVLLVPVLFTCLNQRLQDNILLML